MSTEENKALARRFYEEVFNQGYLDTIDKLLAPNIVAYPMPPGFPAGAEGVKQIIGMYLNAFPDIEMTVDELVAEGNSVACLSTMRGTHTGDLMGIAPTGKRIEAKGLDLFHFNDDKVTAVWHFEEELSMWQQLGVAPPME